MLYRFACLLLCSALGATPIAAASPEHISYQGYLTDAAGSPRDGDVSVIFRIYDTATGGASLWSDTQLVSVSEGLFSVELGADSGTPFPENLFEVPLWLGIEIDGDTEMVPRRRLTAVGFAFEAGDADRLDGLEAAEIIEAAAPVQYDIVGITAASIDGIAGYKDLTAACQAEFGSAARLANSRELIETANVGALDINPPSACGWLDPRLVYVADNGGTFTVVDVSGQRFASVSTPINGIGLNCENWSGFSIPGPSDLQGLVWCGGGTFAVRGCSTQNRVVCSAPR